MPLARADQQQPAQGPAPKTYQCAGPCGQVKGYQAFGADSLCSDGTRLCRACRLAYARADEQARAQEPDPDKPLPADVAAVIKAKLTPLIDALITERLGLAIEVAVREALRAERAEPHHLFQRAQAAKAARTG